MSLRDWPQGERPRQRLLRQGETQLSDAELLAILLQSGVSGRSALEIARDLLRRFGDLDRLMAASNEALCRMPGIGAGKLARLRAVNEIGLRLLEVKQQSKDLLTSSAATRDYLRRRYRNCPREVFICLFLTNQHHIVKMEELFQGTIDGAAVYPREVVRRCLDHNAAAVIFAHNHPSGVAEPSQADIDITQRLRQALDTIGVRVLDHLVIGAEQVVSLAERDLM